MGRLLTVGPDGSLLPPSHRIGFMPMFVLRLKTVDQTMFFMTSVSLSPKFQVVIPRDFRRALSLSPGQRLEVRLMGDRIELIPVQPMAAMRGLFQGIDTRVEDDDAELTAPQP